MWSSDRRDQKGIELALLTLKKRQYAAETEGSLGPAESLL
jgi:hypothetical protein